MNRDYVNSVKARILKIEEEYGDKCMDSLCADCIVGQTDRTMTRCQKIKKLFNEFYKTIDEV